MFTKELWGLESIRIGFPQDHLIQDWVEPAAVKPEDCSLSLFLSFALLRVLKLGLWGPALTQNSVKTRHKKQPTDPDVVARVSSYGSALNALCLSDHTQLVLSNVPVNHVGQSWTTTWDTEFCGNLNFLTYNKWRSEHRWVWAQTIKCDILLLFFWLNRII